jgi:hypothetical protein
VVLLLFVVNVIDGLLKVAQLTDVHVFDISIAFSLMHGHDFIGISLRLRNAIELVV